MTLLSLQLSRALAKGRTPPPCPASRADLLLALLHKRAAARNAGSPELEGMLRNQILWALPILRPGTQNSDR